MQFQSILAFNIFRIIYILFLLIYSLTSKSYYDTIIKLLINVEMN